LEGAHGKVTHADGWEGTGVPLETLTSSHRGTGTPAALNRLRHPSHEVRTTTRNRARCDACEGGERVMLRLRWAAVRTQALGEGKAKQAREYDRRQHNSSS
jgi:hypothetical protein